MKLKKILLACVFLAALLLSGCGSSKPGVAAMRNCSFQYNEESGDYSVFFGLYDEKNRPVSAAVDADIKIVNADGVKVYSAMKTLTADDFGSYTSEAEGDRYLANVKIPADKIAAAKAADGELRLTVYMGGDVYEASCEIYGILPLKEIQIETMKGWMFQENPGSNDYSLFFGLLDEDGDPADAELDVDIRIVNDKNEEVYTAERTVSADDFGYYTRASDGEEDTRYLANIRIPAKDIAEGKSSSGTVYFTVYQNGIMWFEESNCPALYCLPTKDIQINFDEFPQNLNVMDYMGGVASVLQIQGAEYELDKNSLTPILRITVSGEKLSGSGGWTYDAFDYKLLDSEGYVVESGTIYLGSLSAGDKFRDESVVIYDIDPGETYTFRLSEKS